MFSKSVKNKWALFLMILAGVVIGGFIGVYLGNLPYLTWLTYGTTFGVSPPFVLDIGILTISIGFTVKFTVAGIIGIIIALIIYKKL